MGEENRPPADPARPSQALPGERQRGPECGLPTPADQLRDCCAKVETLLREGELTRAREAAGRAVEAFQRSAAEGRARKEDLVRLVGVLARLGDDRRLYAVYRRYVRAEPVDWDGLTLARLGIAAFNVGRRREARWLWRRAGQKPLTEEVMAVYLYVLDLIEAGAVPPFRMDYSFGRGEEPGPEPSGSVKAFALYALWEGEDEEAREAALDLLAQSEPAWAEPFLFGFLRMERMPDALKLKAGGWLIERGFLWPDTPVWMHVDGELREVVIATEPPAPPYPGLLPRAGSRRRGEARPHPPARVRARREPSLHGQMHWAEMLEAQSKEVLLGLARRLGLRGAGRMRKGPLAETLARLLQGRARHLVAALTPLEAALLHRIAREGGVVPQRALLAAADETERALQTLQVTGLLFAGREGRRGRSRRVVAIPVELREVLLGARSSH